MNAYIYTTDNPNVCLVAVGEDENEAKVNAEQAISTRPNTKLQGFQRINHSIIIAFDVIILTRATSDEALIRKILAYFGPEARIELRNDNHPDGTVTKRFYVEEVGRIDLQLKKAEQVADYEKNGLNEKIVEELINRLKPFVKPVEAPPELAPVLVPAEEGGNGVTFAEP
jgi:hypothetical protein